MPSRRTPETQLAFPALHGAALLKENPGLPSDLTTLNAVKFYPFTELGVDPVFAFTSQRETYICRISGGDDQIIEKIRIFEDEDANAVLYVLCWSQDIKTGHPLICITGQFSKILVLNVQTGNLVKTFASHGALVNDLKTYMHLPNIIASCSDDYTIRLWDLNATDENKGCVAMLAGGGHRAEIKMIAFHRNGRYLLSGGLDSGICLWLLPDLLNENSTTKDDLEIEPGLELVRYPHFVSQEIHGDVIDCIDFYGDFIISKSAREPYISMWRITGFDSARTPIPHTQVSTTLPPAVSQTRSAFTKDNKSAFQIVMRFYNPNSSVTWTHFTLYDSPSAHPLLMVGSNDLTIAMWDLQALEDNIFGDVKVQDHQGNYKKPRKAAIESAQVRRGTWEGPFVSLLPHKTIGLPYLAKVAVNSNYGATVRDFSHSSDGRWIVAVGDQGLVCVMRAGEQSGS